MPDDHCVDAVLYFYWISLQPICVVLNVLLRCLVCRPKECLTRGGMFADQREHCEEPDYGGCRTRPRGE